MIDMFFCRSRNNFNLLFIKKKKKNQFVNKKASVDGLEKLGSCKTYAKVAKLQRFRILLSLSASPTLMYSPHVFFWSPNCDYCWVRQRHLSFSAISQIIIIYVSSPSSITISKKAKLVALWKELWCFSFLNNTIIL